MGVQSGYCQKYFCLCSVFLDLGDLYWSTLSKILFHLFLGLWSQGGRLCPALVGVYGH